MRRPRATEESRARAARITQALAELLPDAPMQANEPRGETSRGGGDCPGCGARLQVTMARHGIELDACEECGGIWLDAGELEVITSGLDPAPGFGAPDEAALRSRVERPAGSGTEVRYRECVRCREVMTRRNFGTISGVIVDECRRHGVFLDAGELEAVEAFLRAGGRAVGEAARTRTANRQMPPAPPSPTPTVRHVDAAAVSALDSLWDLFFR